MSTFDAAAFENTVIEGSNETKATPVPEGTYHALIEAVKIVVRAVNGEQRPILSVTFKILEASPELLAQMNREELFVTHDIWLDVTANGSLARGPNQNLGLGKLREACKMNNPSQQFAFKMLEGYGPLVIEVGTRPGKEEGDIFNKVKAVKAA